VWILFLHSDGSVYWGREIATGLGDFEGDIGNATYFGASTAAIGDVDGDGVIDVAVGATMDRDHDDGGDGVDARGAIWILFLEPSGSVKGHQKISDTAGGFEGELTAMDLFGTSLAFPGDLDGDGFGDLVSGAVGDDDGGSGRGALWLLHLQGCPAASATFRNPTVGGITNPAVYDVVALPSLDGEFVAAIDTTGKNGSFLVGYASPFALATAWGNLLLDVTDPLGELLGWPSATGKPSVISIALPDEPVLCGFTCSTQAIRFGGGFDLTNAQDLVLGR